MNRIWITICLVLSISVGGCATTASQHSSDKRQSILEMKDQVLKNLYKYKPSVEPQISSAPGYGVFNNVNLNIIFAGLGGGYGVVTDNETNKNTYMKMGEVGLGFGLGAKDFNLVFVFHDKETLNRFIEHGWAFGVQADAAAKASAMGAAVGGELTVDNITIYQLTKTGLALQVTVKGTKYWKDTSLN